mmetsp:Transcript_9371/g.21435  ORF Transcript_9371/g.21435 Transcript_9371/m.21435 type:complete len:221 (-) Transcript_9371:1547-2209(-)
MYMASSSSSMPCSMIASPCWNVSSWQLSLRIASACLGRTRRIAASRRPLRMIKSSCSPSISSLCLSRRSSAILANCASSAKHRYSAFLSLKTLLATSTRNTRFWSRSNCPSSTPDVRDAHNSLDTAHEMKSEPEKHMRYLRMCLRRSRIWFGIARNLSKTSRARACGATGSTCSVRASAEFASHDAALLCCVRKAASSEEDELSCSISAIVNAWLLMYPM